MKKVLLSVLIMVSLVFASCSNGTTVNEEVDGYWSRVIGTWEGVDLDAPGQILTIKYSKSSNEITGKIEFFYNGEFEYEATWIDITEYILTYKVEGYATVSQGYTVFDRGRKMTLFTPSPRGRYYMGDFNRTSR